MRFLICSDGMPAADDATRIGGLLAVACNAEVTLLGIAEKPVDEQPLREAVETQAEALRKQNIPVQVIIGSGEPVQEIVQRTTGEPFELVVIGSRRRRTTGLYWRSQKTYEVIKSIPAPVLVAVGEVKQLKRFLICTGGKQYISGALELTGKLAAAARAKVTLLHVMAEPPAMYADLVRMEDDAERLLSSTSELSLALHRQKEDLEKLGAEVEVRVRHGLVINQIMAEARDGAHDVIVTGSSQGRGWVRHYTMGDVTRSIVNRSDIPVLVARPVPHLAGRGIFAALRRMWGGNGG